MKETYYVLPKRILDNYLPGSLKKVLKSKEGEMYKLKDQDYPDYASVSVSDQARILGMKVFDTSLLLSFVNFCNIQYGVHPVGIIVWCYDADGYKGFGRPEGITREGILLAKIYNHRVQVG